MRQPKGRVHKEAALLGASPRMPPFRGRACCGTLSPVQAAHALLESCLEGRTRLRDRARLSRMAAVRQGAWGRPPSSSCAQR